MFAEKDQNRMQKCSLTLLENAKRGMAKTIQSSVNQGITSLGGFLPNPLT